MAQNYVLLERIELNNTASSVTFSNIPQTGYTDLKLVISGRATGSRADDSLGIRFNADSTTANYSVKYLRGNGSSATSGGNDVTSGGYVGQINGGSSTANTFTSADIYIPNYTSSNQKSFSVDIVEEANQTTVYAELHAMLWSGTSAITSITFFDFNSNSFAQYSTFSLYGIAAVGTTPVVAPKADGGNVIATDGTYWYHAFLSNGTFTPQVGLSADVLMVGGGGSGGLVYGNQNAGGGGAGGLVYTSATTLASGTNYACAIGAGGAGQTSYLVKGNNGIETTFTGLTTAIGGGAGASGQTAGASSGGSGGGGGGGDAVAITAGTGSQGSNGGTGLASFNSAGAGGGGYSSAGGNASGTTGGNGGAGTNTYSAWSTATSTGVSGYYAGGGGGTGSSTQGSGGAGGGSAATRNSSTGLAGTANTGGGAGAHHDSGGTTAGGNGGSGIIIIRYAV